MPYVFRHTIPVQPRYQRQGRQQRDIRWVAPFGNPRIGAYSRLPVAYRRVSRPSSPLAAKASTKRPYALDLIQKKQGSFWCQKLVLPVPGLPRAGQCLDLERLLPCRNQVRRSGFPTWRPPRQRLVLFSHYLHDVKSPRPAMRVLVERTGIEPVTS